VGGGIQAQAHISSVDLQTGRLSLIPGSTGKFSPRVSPDGRYITAIEAPSDLKVLLFDQQTQKWSELMSTKLPGTGWQKWSTDSKYLYVFNSRDSHAPVLYRVRVADGKIEQVAEFKIPEGLTGFWTGWMGLTADGSPLMLRDLSIQEIYALDVDLP
jgi:Tol biopolymer transport system component